jgi:hypothetical protein
LSSVVLASWTGWFANYQSRRDKQIRNAETVQRLDTEIGNRAYEALAGLLIDEKRIQRNPEFGPTAIYTNIVSYLDNSFAIDPSKVRDFSIYPDYRSRSFRSLVLELNFLVGPSERPELKDALAGYEKIADLASLPKEPGNDNNQQSEFLTAVAKSHEFLSSHLLRWRSYLQP